MTSEAGSSLNYKKGGPKGVKRIQHRGIILHVALSSRRAIGYGCVNTE